MNEQIIISKINEYLHTGTIAIAQWLGKMLPKVSSNWWKECILDKLSFNQLQIVEEKKITRIDSFDLAALLRIADKNWYAMREFVYLSTNERDCIREMMTVRNNWAHCSGSLPVKEDIIADLTTIIHFFEQMNVEQETVNSVQMLIDSLDKTIVEKTVTISQDNPTSTEYEITLNSVVTPVGQPGVNGVVLSIEKLNGTEKYTVFIEGAKKIFYTGQIVLADEGPKYTWIDIKTLQGYLSAFEINNPSSGNLYSLNSARIDFVPYQFRPALKLIKSDEPRILIADSVGVGKTIEAGLIIKELEARSNLENVMIICPKPLVSERKWELEMKRFDEDFEPLNGSSLRQIINDMDRDGEWPARHSKTIVPYSILDSRVLYGDENRKENEIGLLNLDPAPHFDLVIIDEAHHIRNGSSQKEKAYAYKCVKYLCDHADAVVMLTATPLQTGDDDLFTLLNVLRPDIVMDKATFSLMSQPNQYISQCASTIRRADDNWQNNALEQLDGIVHTQWGENVIAENPLYNSVITRLESGDISRDERVKLLTDVESLHSFNSMINRTRRRDIQDFCIRRSHTIETEFSPEQQVLHDALLDFEKAALSKLHNVRCVPFMMSTIKRQAASCVFGLAPHMRDLIEKRFNQIADDPDIDVDNFIINESDQLTLKALAHKVLSIADNLPTEDTKFDKLLEIINQKQLEDNNKIILFSTYRYTLRYLRTKLESLGYRVNQIDGDVKDDDRCLIRDRFKLPKQDDNAIDILLFTEVGSEGLDYQFCNMMINYDLPWNPMRIEQRIGRIDRRGQTSEYVNIYNMITAGTVDADIYYRCLLRINIFEKSIGECEEILGEIGNQIEKIGLNIGLTDEERHVKLEQMADNEVRKVQELNKLEEEEKELFGFDLSTQTMSQEIHNAESPWISPKGLQGLVTLYLNERIGKGIYILGESEGKTLRISAQARAILREDLNKLNGVPASLKRKWEVYLKGTAPNHPITFDSDYASRDRNAFFITTVHPLVRQAAMFFAVNTPTHVSIRYSSDTLPSGKYAFSIYAWNYVGVKPHFRLVTVCENDEISNIFTDIVQSGAQGESDLSGYEDKWEMLENKHIEMLMLERKNNSKEAKLAANYKLESLRNNFKNKKRLLEEQIRNSVDDSILRMKKNELENDTTRYEHKVQEIQKQIEQSEIHTDLIANGVIQIN